MFFCLLLSLIAFLGESPELFILVAVFLIFALIILKVFSENKIKKVLNNLSDEEIELLSMEMESEKTLYYERANLFLTERHIILIIFGGDLFIIKYSDIISIYHSSTDIGVQGGRQLNVYTRDNRTQQIITSPFGKEQEKHLEIMNYISNKNPNVIRGHIPKK